MTAGPVAALAVLLAFAAVWEIVGSRGEELRRALRLGAAALSGGRVRSLAEAALWLGLPERIARAGLAGRLSPGAVLVAKCAGALAFAGLATVAAPATPGRLGLTLAIALTAAGFIAPDALLERAARRRRARVIAALPDALDLLAVGAAGGRGPAAVLGEISATTGGPLATELAGAVAEIECGSSVSDAVDRMRSRIQGAELGALAATLERSRRYGSPLADQLREQATALRRDARRRVNERAARAAPKIQLVVALVLVPSVLLTIVAALIAHSDALLGPL